MFPSCCYSTLRERENGTRPDWRRPKPIEEARRGAKANWKQALSGEQEEGGRDVCGASRRRLTPGNSEKAERPSRLVSYNGGAARRDRERARNRG